MIGDHTFTERFNVIALAILFSQFSHRDFHRSALGSLFHESLVLFAQGGALSCWTLLCYGHPGNGERRKRQSDNTNLRYKCAFYFH